jgi:CO/xanthine dehydrogenase Mo-binding subunit
VGQGSDTVLSQIAAQTLGVPLECVRIGQPDTDTSPYDWGTAGSRLTNVAGRAVERAAQDMRNRVLESAARLLESDPSDLEIAGKQVQVKGAPHRSVSLSKIGGVTHEKTGPLQASGSAAAEPRLDPDTIREGISGPPHQDLGFGAVACEVEVDTATGEVRPLRVVAAHDVGAAIHPRQVEGQIEGAVVQGLGYALAEEMVIEDGSVRNTLLNDYLVPMATTIPPIESIVLETGDGQGPFGSHGVGEHGLLGVAPAIANAVYAAVGVRLRTLPLTPERILDALRERDATEQEAAPSPGARA